MKSVPLEIYLELLKIYLLDLTFTYPYEDLVWKTTRLNIHYAWLYYYDMVMAQHLKMLMIATSDR